MQIPSVLIDPRYPQKYIQIPVEILPKDSVTLFFLRKITNLIVSTPSEVSSARWYFFQHGCNQRGWKLVEKFIRSIKGTASNRVSEESHSTILYMTYILSKKKSCGRSLLSWHIWIFLSSWYFVEESLRQITLVTFGFWWLKKDVPEISTLDHTEVFPDV